MHTIENRNLDVDPDEEGAQLHHVSGFFRGEWLTLWPVWILGMIMFVLILWFAFRG